jgi:hypothetical protein
MGVGFYGLVKDVMALIPLDELTALLDKKLETRELFTSLLTAIRSLDIMVNIHCVYLNISCCLCYVFEFLWWMHYTFPQKMVDTVRTWPEYREVLEILREMVPYVERIYYLLREPSLRGNVFNNWKRNGNSLYFVIKCIKLLVAE